MSCASPSSQTAVASATDAGASTTPTFRQSLVASITRSYPLYSGRGRVANHPLVSSLIGPVEGSGLVWAQVTGGEILAPLRDHVGRAAFFCGDLDPKVTWIFRKLIQRGDTVLDIGANIGVTTVAMASMTGPTGRVHSFEPNPELQHLLKQVIERNHLTQATLHSMALGPIDTLMELRVPQSNFGMGSLVHHGNPTDAIHSVPVRRLDDIVIQEGITSIRLIKIDVEGFEADVFEGAQNVLRDMAPDAILFELNDEKGAFGEQPVVQILDAAGYDFLAVPVCKVQMHLRHKPLTEARQPGENDYLAVRKGEVSERIARLTGAA
jgi:FkbM family methyltransferase